MKAEILESSSKTIEEKRPGWVRRFYRRADKGLLTLALIFVLTLPIFTPRIYASDEIKYFSYLHSIIFDHDVDFTNEYTYFYNSNPKKYEDFKRSVLDKPNEKGLPYNDGPVGSAIMWSPFYLVAHGAAYIGQGLGFKSFKPDGYSTPYIWAVTLASLLYGFIGLILCYLLIRNFVPRFYAALATAAIWLASPVIFYMSLTPPMSHANSLFMISLWLYIWYNTRGWRYDGNGKFIPGHRSGPKWLLLGVLGGFMTTVREQDGTVLIVAAIESLFLYYYFWKQGKTGRTILSETGAATAPLPNRYEKGGETPPLPNRYEKGGETPPLQHNNGNGHRTAISTQLETRNSKLETANRQSSIVNRQSIRLFLGNMQLLVGLGLGLIPLLLVYQALNGHPGPSKLVGDKLGFFSLEVVGRFFALMFDLDHGMFLWSPILLPAVIGLIMMIRDRRLRLVGVVLLAAYLCELYISASFQTWTMKGSFGARRLVGISPAYIAGLAYLGYWLAEARKGWHLRRRWLVAAAVLFIAWNFGLIIQFSAIRDEQGRQNLDFPRVVADQFTQVPGKLVTTAQKFFTDRSSFYKK